MVDVFAHDEAMRHVAHASVGTVHTDEGPHAARMMRPDVLYQTGLTTLPDGTTHSVEHLLASAFFPYDTGFYQKPQERGVSMTFAKYLKFRCLQGFTCFTKQSPYLLLMRSLENARAAISNAFGRYVVNKRAFDQTKQKLEEQAEAADTPPPTTANVRSSPPCLFCMHSNAAPHLPVSVQVLDKLVKNRVSDKVPGSPATFKKAKRDLDALVREAGMGHYFVTITMNETGAFASQEYTNIDAIMKAWLNGSDWRDAPVECNRAFVARFETLLREYILDDTHRIFGDVKDYALRYECQGRGSLHVHMVIWLRTPEDIAALDKRIISCVPCPRAVASRASLPSCDFLKHAGTSLRTTMMSPTRSSSRPTPSNGACTTSPPTRTNTCAVKTDAANPAAARCSSPSRSTTPTCPRSARASAATSTTAPASATASRSPCSRTSPCSSTRTPTSSRSSRRSGRRTS